MTRRPENILSNHGARRFRPFRLRFVPPVAAPMNAMQRHMLWRLLACTGAVCGVLTFAIILLNTFGLFELWRLGTMGLPTFLLVNLLTVPPILCQTGPLGVTIAVVFLYQGWIRNSEIVALSAAGLSLRRIAMPGIVTGVIAMLCTAVTSLYLLGATFPVLADLVFASKVTLSSEALQEGYLNEISPTMALSFQHRLSLTELTDVTLLQWPEPGKFYVVTADRGVLTDTPAGVVLALDHGRLQREIDGQSEAPVTFDRMNAMVRPAIDGRGRGRGFYEKPLGQLLAPPATGKENTPEYVYGVVEGHQRIITPFVCLNYILLALGILLARGEPRRGLALRITIVGAVIATLHIAMVGTHSMVAHYIRYLPLLYLYAFVPGLIGAALLVSARPRPFPRRRLRLPRPAKGPSILGARGGAIAHGDVFGEGASVPAEAPSR